MARSYPSWHYHFAAAFFLIQAFVIQWYERPMDDSTAFMVSLYFVIGGMALGVGIYQQRRRIRPKEAL